MLMGNLRIGSATCLVLLLFVLLTAYQVSSFGGPLHHRQGGLSQPTMLLNTQHRFIDKYRDVRSSTTTSRTSLFMVDPATWAAAITTGVGSFEPVATAGIALISAAAGAASTIPRIQALENELSVVKKALDASEAAYRQKLDELEENLFQLDKEYESQTASLKKEWDRQKVNELNALQKKLQEEMQFKLDMEVEKEKSKILTQTALQWNGYSTNKGTELTQMRIRQTQLEASKEELEKALHESLVELHRLNTAVADGTKKKFFGLF